MLLPFKDRKEERGQVELLQALLKLANQLQSNLDLDAVVDVIAGALCDTFGFTEVCVYVREGEEPVLRARAAESRDRQADQCALDTPCAVATAEGAAHRGVPRGQRVPRPGGRTRVDEELRRCLPQIAAERGAAASAAAGARGDSLLVPLYDKQRRLTGLLRLGGPITGLRPGTDVIASLSAFATHAAVAIENAREHQQLQEVTAQLEEQLEVRHELLDGSRALLSTLDEVAVFAKISQMLDALVGYDALGIGLARPRGRTGAPGFLRRRRRRRRHGGHAVPSTTPCSRPPSAPASAVLLDDRTEGRRCRRCPGATRSPKSVILAPLAVGGEAFGLLGVGRYREDAERFGVREFELVQLFANLAAIALQNARSYKEMLHLASSDGLTGVHNYRHFRETLAMEVEPRRTLRRDVLPADDGPGPFQGGQRHRRPSARRRGAEGRGRHPQAVLARVGLLGPLRRRGVRHDPAAHASERGGARWRSASAAACARSTRARRRSPSACPSASPPFRRRPRTWRGCCAQPTQVCCAPRPPAATGSASSRRTARSRSRRASWARSAAASPATSA